MKIYTNPENNYTYVSAAMGELDCDYIACSSEATWWGRNETGHLTLRCDGHRLGCAEVPIHYPR